MSSNRLSLQKSKLEIKGLTISRNEQILLENVDIEFDKGSITHLYGENGSGKTSLMRALAGLLPLDSGQVLWNGKETHHPEALFADDLLFLAHDLAMKDELTIAENLKFYSALRSNTLSSSNIISVTQALNLHNLLDRHFAELSAGQQHKVSLCRLVLEKSRLWILDEPFVNLDAHTRTWLSTEMMTFAKSGGVVIFTSHQEIEELTIHQKISLSYQETSA